jgi:hypothetical protein
MHRRTLSRVIEASSSIAEQQLVGDLGLHRRDHHLQKIDRESLGLWDTRVEADSNRNWPGICLVFVLAHFVFARHKIASYQLLRSSLGRRPGQAYLAR